MQGGRAARYSRIACVIVLHRLQATHADPLEEQQQRFLRALAQSLIRAIIRPARGMIVPAQKTKSQEVAMLRREPVGHLDPDGGEPRGHLVLGPDEAALLFGETPLQLDVQLSEAPLQPLVEAAKVEIGDLANLGPVHDACLVDPRRQVTRALRWQFPTFIAAISPDTVSHRAVE
jgi:hypothetical protein